MNSYVFEVRKYFLARNIVFLKWAQYSNKSKPQREYQGKCLQSISIIDIHCSKLLHIYICILYHSTKRSHLSWKFEQKFEKHYCFIQKYFALSKKVSVML